MKCGAIIACPTIIGQQVGKPDAIGSKPNSFKLGRVIRVFVTDKTLCKPCRPHAPQRRFSNHRNRDCRPLFARIALSIGENRIHIGTREASVSFTIL